MQVTVVHIYSDFKKSNVIPNFFKKITNFFIKHMSYNYLQ